MTKIKNIYKHVLHYACDMFKCDVCGYALRVRVMGNTYKCPQCGATMRRL